MNKIILASVAGAALALSGTAVMAQSASIGNEFQSVDTDRNGLVSWAEFSLLFTDIPEAQFNTADADGDGSLNAEEFDSIALSTGSITPLPAPSAPAANLNQLDSLTYDPGDDAD